MDKTMVEYALEYARMGWPVFPLHTPVAGGRCSCGKRECDNLGKHPRTIHGRDDASTNEATIRRWWEIWPDANIGIATGDGLLIVDFDIDHDKGKYGDETLALIQEEHEELPDTVMAITGGGGLHYFFHCTADDLTINQAVLPGMDFRGNGGYVVAPPSLHVSGRRYEWEGAHEPWDTELAELPIWLHDILAAGKGGKQKKRFEAPEVITEGGRNGTMFRMASSLRAKGLSEAAITAAVWEENLLRCRPPLERREIETICASAGKYERGDGIDRLQTDAAASERIANADHGSFETLTDTTVLEAALRLSDPVEREKRLSELRGHAKELHRVRDFDRILRAQQEVLAKTVAQEAAEQTQDVIDLPDCPLPGLRCFGWEVGPKGIKKIVGDDFGDACSHPLIITERLTNIDTCGERLKLAFYRDKQWKYLIVDKSTVASRTKIIELADSGIQVNSENAKLLIQYLHDLEAQNAYRIPRKRCVSRVGWAGQEFVPYVDDVQYDGDPKYASYFNAVSCAGDYEEWKRRAIEERERSPVARIALAASFASPLMWPLGAQVFFLHLWGGTEVGKTVCQMLAMSVWGNPDLGALLRSYNATYVAVERMAAFCHSIPLALDEQQTVRNNRYFNMDTLIYNLCEGQGKGRGTKSGAMENMSTWRLCVLSSGEGTLTSTKSGGGSKNRVLEIYCKEKIFRDAAGTAEFVKENYGYAGKEYIARISNPAVIKEAKERFTAYRKIIAAIGRGTDKQVAAAAMLAVGDAYASMFVFGLEKEEAESNAVAFCSQLSAYLTDPDEVSQVERAYKWINGWIAANPGKFRHKGNAGEYTIGNGSELWGKENDKRTGYIIIANEFERGLEEAGYNADACVNGFIERGYILPGNTRKTKQSRIGGIRPWCYEVIMPMLEPGELEEISDMDPDDPWQEEKTIQFPSAHG